MLGRKADTKALVTDGVYCKGFRVSPQEIHNMVIGKL